MSTLPATQPYRGIHGFSAGDAKTDAAFAFTVVPIRDDAPDALVGMAKRRRVDLCSRAIQETCEVQGWYLPVLGVEVHGIRVVKGGQYFVARRKQFRAEAHAVHPDRLDAIHSGFTASVSLETGWNHLVLQYKNEQRRWTAFATCDVHLPWYWRLVRGIVRRGAASSYEQWLRWQGDADEAELRRMKEALREMPERPLLSVLLPVYNTPEKWLCRAIESVQNQVYPHWELCVADDCSPSPKLRRLLEKFARRDSRIRVCYRAENGHICRSSNSALELCQGDFTVLLDHDDELPPHALFHIAWEATQHPDASIIFSDEDKVDSGGVRSDPYFKPGWNYDLLLGQNCVSHLGAFRTSVMREVGGFRPGYEGSQDWDLTLRVVAHSGLQSVRHIPRVLYHWRTLPTSTASSMEAKPYAASAGRRAVMDHLQVVGSGAEVRPLKDGGWQILWPLPEPLPRVTLIMPTKDQLPLLKKALESHFAVTAYPDVEVMIIDHESEKEETRSYLSELKRSHPGAVHVVSASGPFNWSALSNLGAQAASGELLVFLNNDVEIISPEWLHELARQAWRKDVGAVGACLLYDHGAIQHAGVVLNMTGIAGHVFRNSPPEAASIGGPPGLVREVTAVTGACMAVRREVFQAAGGFDEEVLPVAYNDVDFCLRLRSRGLRNVYTPFARLVHHESQSRQAMETTSARKAAVAREAEALLRRWSKELAGDRFYNPNLSLEIELPAMGKSRVLWSWMCPPPNESTAAVPPSSNRT
jgi:GT2 family glycosyltransferase